MELTFGKRPVLGQLLFQFFLIPFTLAALLPCLLVVRTLHIVSFKIKKHIVIAAHTNAALSHHTACEKASWLWADINSRYSITAAKQHTIMRNRKNAEIISNMLRIVEWFGKSDMPPGAR